MPTSAIFLILFILFKLVCVSNTVTIFDGDAHLKLDLIGQSQKKSIQFHIKRIARLCNMWTARAFIGGIFFRCIVQPKISAR